MKYIRKLWDRTQDGLDAIGRYWSSKRRVHLFLALFFYFLVLLTDEVVSYTPGSTSYSNLPHELSVGIEVTLLLVFSIFFCVCGVDFTMAESYFLYVDSATIACLTGWNLLKIIYLNQSLLLVVLNFIVIAVLYLVDLSTQRLKQADNRKRKNLSQLLRRQSKKGHGLEPSNMSMGSLYSTQSNFQQVTPTFVIDENEYRSVRVGINESVRQSDLTMSEQGVSPPSSPCTALPIEIDDASTIEYDGFRVKLDSLPPGAVHVPENVPWSSFEFVEHRIDSSSCHIYTAIWQETPVIIKLIKADRLSSAMAVSEFEMEASILSRVRHPNIVRLLGSGTVPRRFLILELLDGGSLSHALGLRPDANKRYTKKKYSYLQILQMARSIASAMDYLHNVWNDNVHIIHRDLKPDNIGWTADGQLKVFDFGLCTCVRSQRDRKEQYRLTGNTGTLRYMAPEVALGRPYNRTVDVYSFGIIMWQVLTNQIPFKRMHKKDYMEKVVAGGQRPPLDRKWPKRLRVLLDLCWHEDKNSRADFGYIVSELDDLIIMAESQEQSWYFQLIRTIKKIVSSVRKGVLWSRPVLLILAVIFLVTALVVLISVPTPHNSHTDHLEVSGIALAILATYWCHLIVMSLVQGTARRPLSSRDLIMGLELNQNPSARYNPMAGLTSDMQPLYGL